MFPDLENSQCMVLRAQNPPSHSRYVRCISEAWREVAKVVVINPKRTTFTRLADIHVQLRPGTDGALALLNAIVWEALHGEELVENWTFGFDKLQEHIRQHTPEGPEAITRMVPEDIRKIAVSILPPSRPA